MQRKIIKSKKDYLFALQRFEQILQAKAGTPENDEADVLSILIKTYEDQHFTINKPLPNHKV